MFKLLSLFTLEEQFMHKLHFLVLIFTASLVCACNNSNTTANDSDTTRKKAIAINTSKKVILFFGDSLTAGYGLDDPSSEAFPAQVQNKIDSLKLPYKVVNGGLSGETSAGGNSRINWLLRQKIDVFILELGANDGLRGLPVAQTTQNLQAIVDKVKAKYPDAKLVLAGMMVPPNMGAAYASSFKALYPLLAKKNHMAFVPFLLQNVAGIRDLNQGDGIHPNPAGAKIVADNVWKQLRPIL